MEQFEIAAEARELKGKGASRRLRRTGYIPGIVYGAGKEPVNIQLEHNDVIKHTDHEAFYSHILSLKLPTGTQRVVLKDMQRHPYKALVMHISCESTRKRNSQCEFHCISLMKRRLSA
jgi:large subunit ribosomal protein L25